MNRFKEKLKAIWRIVTSREYLILYSNNTFKCRVISNHNSVSFLEYSKQRIDNKINLIKRIKHASEELNKVGFTSKDVEKLFESFESTPRNSLMYIKDIDKEIPKAFGADVNIPQDY